MSKKTKQTQKHAKTRYNKKLPGLIHPSTSPFLSPLIWPTNQPMHPRSSTKNISPPRCPPTPPPIPPREPPCLGLSVSQGKSAPCSVHSAHIITQHSHSPRTSTPQKASPNLIILVFHQVERFGRWRIGIWLLIYPLHPPHTHTTTSQLQMEPCSWQQLHE